MVRLTDRPDMTLDVYRGRKTTMQQLSFFALLTHLCFRKTNFVYMISSKCVCYIQIKLYLIFRFLLYSAFLQYTMIK